MPDSQTLQATGEILFMRSCSAISELLTVLKDDANIEVEPNVTIIIRK